MIYYHFVWQVLSDIFYTMISNNPLCRSALSSLLNIEAALCRLERFISGLSRWEPLSDGFRCGVVHAVSSQD
jgi:hypothetical protein